MKKSLPFSVAVGLLAIGLMGSAARAAGGGACSDDAQKFCSGVQPGEGRIADCLKQHAADLSPACKEQGAEMKQKMEALQAACSGDVEKYCASATGGHGARLQCLKSNESKLSAGCQAALSQMHHGGNGGPPPAP